MNRQQEADSDFPGLKRVGADIKMPRDNTIVAVYRREDKYGYIPFQFSNKCYHTSSGNARCFPESGSHGGDRYETGFGGGKDGRLVDAKCLSGYVFFGVTCSRPLDTATRGAIQSNRKRIFTFFKIVTLIKFFENPTENSIEILLICAPGWPTPRLRPSAESKATCSTSRQTRCREAIQ